MNFFKKKILDSSEDPSIEEREKKLKKDRATFEHEKFVHNLKKEFTDKVLDYQKKYDAKSIELTVANAETMDQHHKDYHAKRADQKVELAVLDKEVAIRKELMADFNMIEDTKRTAMKTKYEAIIVEKDATITRLDGIVKVLTTKLPDVDLKNMNITLNPNKE